MYPYINYYGQQDRATSPLDGYAPLGTYCFIRNLGNHYVCLLCNTKDMIRSDDTTHLHIMSHDHQSRFKQVKSNLLSQIPSDSSIQMNSLKAFLDRLYYQQTLSDNSYNLRDMIINQFEYLLNSVDVHCSLRVFGSHLTRTSLIHSNINIEILHPNSKLFKRDPRAKNSIHHKLVDPLAKYGEQFNLHTKEYDLAPNAIETLYKLYLTFSNPYNSEFCQFFQIYSNKPYKDMVEKVPKLILRHVDSGIILELSCYNESSYRLSELLKIYTSLDMRVRELSCLIKYWANICSLDKPENGTYPPETFIILVIYYLQRTNPPILPCLHEIYSNIFKSNNTSSNGANSSLKSDEKKVDLVMDKFAKMNLSKNTDLGSSASYDNKENSSGSSKENRAEIINDQEQEAIEEDIEDDEEDEEYTIFSDIHQIQTIIDNWTSQNNQPLHYLFIDFMKTMFDEFDDCNHAISITTLKKVVTSKRNWQGKTKAIENPIKPKLNISRCIGSMRQHDYMKNCFKRAFYYLTSLPLNSSLRIEEEYKHEPQDYITLYYDIERMEFYFRMRWSSGQVIPKEIDTCTEMIQQQLFARDVDVEKALLSNIISPESIHKSVANSYQKKFLIPHDFEAAIFCWLCRLSGHNTDDCENVKISTLAEDISNYDNELDESAHLDSLFKEMYYLEAISPNISLQHERVTLEISDIISKEIPDTKFHLERFGSTVNNLGCVDSDIDICMTIEGNTTGQNVDCVTILEKVSNILEQMTPKAHKIEPVLSARVPIIRFKYENYDIDLSMYNHCALYNSQLLKLYSSIDERVPILTYLVKKIAKVR